MKHAILLTCIGLLAACSETPPNALVTKFKDGVVTGEYDPAFWNADSIRQNAAANSCPSGKGIGYTETVQSNGRVAFSVRCA